MPESDLADPGRPILLFGVGGTVLLFEVSDKLDLFKIQISEIAYYYFQSLWLNLKELQKVRNLGHRPHHQCLCINV